MDSNAGGYSAATINYNTPSVAEMLNDGAKLNEQRNYRNQELSIQRAKLQQDNDKDKYSWIQGATDHNKYISGQTAVDQHAFSALDEVMKAAMTDPDFHNESYGAFMAKYTPHIQAIAQGHLIAKQQLDNAYKQIDDASKDDPNLDTTALKQRAFNEVRNSVLDDNGNYRTADQIDPNRDIAGSLLNAPDSYKYVLGAQPLMDMLGSNKGEETNAITQLPNGTIVTHSGKRSDFQQQDWTVGANGFANKLPTFSIKTQNVPDPSNPNATVPVLDKGVFDKTFGQDAPKSNQRQFLSLWNHYKEGTGLQTTPQNEGLYQQMYARVLVQDKVKNQMQQVHAEHLPKQGNTIINMGQPAINDINAKIDRAIDYDAQGNPRQHHNEDAPTVPFNELPPDAQEVVFNLVKNSGFTKRQDNKEVPLGSADIYIKRENGAKYIMQRTPNGKPDKLIAPYDYASVNLAAHSGNTSAKQKQEVLHHAPATPAATATTTTTTDNKWAKYKRN